mmetsp:Transcript_2369/g.3440  ORF Transcript_2369/g.3440 Transcript_2369/m.3440 type:complete len:519 (+) Transcript_2369:23-1579(+)
MKLDAKYLRYLTADDFRVLLSIEMGMRNHELVPTTLIERIANLKSGGVRKVLSFIAKKKLVHHDSKPYDGYKLTYLGYDYLALNTFIKRQLLWGVGSQVGVGKESDIYICLDMDQKEVILKLHRLGRVSFRTIKSKRDYLQHRKAQNWLYLSRLSALKEYAFMKALYETGFPVPKPISQNRHCVLMSIVDGYPLYQYKKIADPGHYMKQCFDLIVRLAKYGLIHGDFNEFNLMLCEKDRKMVMIDFPQMISTNHYNAEFYFQRDIQCIHDFFEKRFNFNMDFQVTLDDVIKETDLDLKVAASGYDKDKEKDLKRLLRAQFGTGQHADEDIDEDLEEDVERVYDDESDDESEEESDEEEKTTIKPIINDDETLIKDTTTQQRPKEVNKQNPLLDHEEEIDQEEDDNQQDKEEENISTYQQQIETILAQEFDTKETNEPTTTKDEQQTEKDVFEVILGKTTMELTDDDIALLTTIRSKVKKSSQRKKDRERINRFAKRNAKKGQQKHKKKSLKKSDDLYW